jgi:3-hydroxyisobutyrate dehydrogenase-like beta-hydroxyacid dehydrogenase
MSVALGQGEATAGIVGCGNMGGRIGRRILASGPALVGFDAEPSRVEAAGIPQATSLAELTGKADIILFSLPDSRVIEAVVYGEGGVLESCRAGQVVVDLSTALPSSTVRIHDAFRAKDVEFVDAGISGGASGAEKGTLSIMAGGSEETLESVRWLLETFASRIYFMGASGSGHTAKVLNNFLNGVSLAATAEVMVAAKMAGLDLETFLDVLNHSSGVNYATLNRFPAVIKGDYLEGGLTGKLMTKDLELYAEVMQELGAPTFAAGGCLAAFRIADELGYGDQISNRVVDAIGDMVGGLRLYDEAPPRAGKHGAVSEEG